MKTSEALYAAADHMEAFGHCSYTAYDFEYLNAGGRVATAPSCMIGSVHQTTGGGQEALPVLAALDRYLAPVEVTVYNRDHTPEEVVAAFRAAALLEEAKENAEVKVLEPAR